MVSTVGTAATTQRSGRLAYRLLLLAVFVSTWTGTTVAGLLQPVDAALLLATLAALPLLTRPVPALPPWPKLLAAAVLLVVVFHVALPAEANYLASRDTLADLQDPIGTAGRWVVALLVLPWLGAQILRDRDERALVRLAWAWALGCAVSAIVAFSDSQGLTSVGPTLIGAENIAGRQSGLASHVNNLGFACAITLPVAVHMMRERKVLGSSTLLLLLVGAFVSGSRGAQVGAVLALGGTLVLVNSARRRVLPRLLYFGALILTAVALFRPTWLTLGDYRELLRFDGSEAVRASDSGRLTLINQAVEDFSYNPFFGVGLDILNHAHSVPLQLLSAGGIVLTVAFAVYISGAWKALQPVGVHGLEPYLRASLVVWMVSGLVENQLTDRYLYVPVLLAVAAQLMRVRAATADVTGPSGP